MQEAISREEHEEFCKRMHDENHRQNRRITVLEDEIKELRNISANIQRLAANMENMAEEQRQQGKRMAELENRDGEKWRTITAHIVTVILTAVITLSVTAFFSKLGF